MFTEGEVIISAGEEEAKPTALSSPSIRVPAIHKSEGENVVQLWRQLASNALGFVKGVFDKFGLDAGGPQLTLTPELLQMFAEQSSIVFLGHIYQLLKCEKIIIQSQTLADENEEIFALLSNSFAESKSKLGVISLFGWRLIGENVMSCTWELASHKVFLTLSAVGKGAKLLVMASDSKLAKGILTDCLGILNTEKSNHKATHCEEFEVYPIEIESSSTVSGFMGRNVNGYWETIPFTVDPNQNKLFENSLVFEENSTLDFDDLQGNRDGFVTFNRCYYKLPLSIKPKIQNEEERIAVLGEFLMDFYTRMWFTYRRAIPEPIGGMMTSDAGWGCMIRSGQCMLAEALLRSLLERDFRMTHLSVEEILLKYLYVAEQFLDTPEAIFSIHRIAQMGAKKCNRAIGEWFGPSVLGHSLAAISGSPIRIMMLPDRVIPVELVCAHPFPVLLLVPVRLGMGTRIEPAYFDLVLQCLRMKSSVGIVGGLPQRSFYFMGSTGTELIYLDPHIVQDALTDKLRILETMELHCQRPKLVPLQDVDPSMLISFLVQSDKDLSELKAGLHKFKSVIDFIL